MKILFTVKALDGITGGAERVLCDVASGLAARGHDVAVLSFDASGAKPYYPLSPSVRFIPLGIGKAAKRATAAETVRRMAALRKAVRAEKPDAVAAFMHSMFIPAAFALAGTGVPVIGSEHIVPEHYKDRPLEFALLFLSSFFLKKMTVLSPRIAESYPWPVRRKMVPVANPVRLPDSPSNLAATTILTVGRLEAQKDQATLVRAFALLAKDYPDWRVRIMGDGALREELQTLIGSCGLSGRVALGGTRPDIGEEYREASIFALPSRYESFGLATAEAMGYGLPVAGFADCPGTNELIADGRTGLLASGGDRVAAFAGCLRRLMDDPSERAQFGAAARRSMEAYRPETIVARWEELLKSV